MPKVKSRDAREHEPLRLVGGGQGPAGAGMDAAGGGKDPAAAETATAVGVIRNGAGHD
ncbi:hypothetical protein SAMN04487915_10694 [Arthrobacter sp. ov118]|jgi:hypothetical protein|nr:hypothetical protein SAMN04487915_10694 [Arthrobacter sp. ov118]